MRVLLRSWRKNSGQVHWSFHLISCGTYVSERGAISVYMALFLASSLILFSVLNILVEYRLFQIRVQAATISQSEQILASFDRKLLERYGLFAYDSSLINTEVFHEEVNCSRKKMEASVDVEEDKSLFELEEFRKQIILFAHPRIPIHSANMIWDRIKNLLVGKEDSNLPVPTGTDLSNTITSYYKPAVTTYEKEAINKLVTDKKLPGFISPYLTIFQDRKNFPASPMNESLELSAKLSAEARIKTSSKRSVEASTETSTKEISPKFIIRRTIPSLNDIRNIVESSYENKVTDNNAYKYSLVDIKEASLDLLDYLKKSEDFYANRDRLKEDINSEDSSSENNQDDESKKSIDSNIDKVNSALADFFGKEDLNRNLARSVLDDIDTSSPERVIEEAAKLFDTLNQCSIPIYDSWCINEYIINQCSSAVRNASKSLIDTSINSNFTLRGDTFTSLDFKTNYETEEIITGLQGRQAELLVKFYIFLMRFLVRGVEVKNDRLKMGAYNAIASVVSFVATLCSLPIPKEAVVASLVFIDSSNLALKDLIKLSKGQSIKLISSKMYKIDYIDHLRIFLIFVSDEAKLSRLGEKIKANVKDNLYTAVNTTSTWNSPFGVKNFTISNEYRFNLAEGGD